MTDQTQVDGVPILPDGQAIWAVSRKWLQNLQATALKAKKDWAGNIIGWHPAGNLVKLHKHDAIDSDYIAAARPDTVLALLAEIDRLRAALHPATPAPAAAGDAGELAGTTQAFMQLGALASDGPWGWGSTKRSGEDELVESRFLYCHRSVSREDEDDNARFIVAARQFVDTTLPALLAERQQLQAQVAAAGAGGWVSVGERLPEPGNKVWASFWHPTGQLEGRQVVRPAFFRPDSVWDEFLWERITHWQPLYVAKPTAPDLVAVPGLKGGQDA